MWRAVDPGVDQSDHAHRDTGQRRAPAIVRRQRQPHRARDVDGALQLARSGADGQHGAARAVRGGHRARRVAVELGQPRRCRPPGHELGLPGARGPGRRGPLLCPGQPRRLRGLRRHVRPHLPDLPRHPVRDVDEHRRRQRHGRPGHDHAQRHDRHHRVLRVDGRLHLECQPAVAVHPGARRRRRGVRDRCLQHQPPVDDVGQLHRHSGRVAPDRHLHRLRRRDLRSGPSLRRLLRARGHHHAQRNRREHHDSRHRVLRRPRPQLGPLRGGTGATVPPSPSRVKGGVTASGWGSGARWATPSGKTMATATGPISRSWATTTAPPRWAACRVA